MAQKKEEKTSKVSREFSSGGVVYKKSRNKKGKGVFVWLVTESNPSKEYPDSVWRLPKGWLDDERGGIKPGPYASGKKKADDEILENAAIREVKEEGGVIAQVQDKICTEKYFYRSKNGEKIFKFVTFYLMRYLKDRKEGFGYETRDIAWLEFDEARKILSHSGEKKILDKARKLLVKGKGNL